MKRCVHCSRDLPWSAFARSNHSKDGLQSWCSECQTAGRRSRTAERRQKTLASLPPVTTKRCPRCAEDKPFAAFSRNGHGYQTYCKPCAEDARREYKIRNAESIALRRAERAARAPTTGEKVCTCCGETRPILEFYVHRGTRDGRAYYCMACQKIKAKEYRQRNADKVKAWNAARDTDLKRRDNRDWWLKAYGLNGEQYQMMLDAQNGLCAICRQTESYIDARTGEPRRLSVDHDHGTGRVRGLLCGACNRGVGQLKDQPELLDAAANYLRGAMP